jgi:hypothetical protein
MEKNNQIFILNRYSMEEFDTSSDNLANLFVKKYYSITGEGENIPNVQNDVANSLNIIANPNPIVRNVTLPTYRALLAEATQQIDALRPNNDAMNPVIEHLYQFYQNGIDHGLWDEFGPAPPPPELRRAGGSKRKKKKKRKTRRRYF